MVNFSSKKDLVLTVSKITTDMGIYILGQWLFTQCLQTTQNQANRNPP